MSDSETSNLERGILIDLEKYAAGANAWYNTFLEHDKSILTLSTLGIGLLITLITSFGVNSSEALILNLLAIISFMISIAVVLIIFKRNGSYLSSRLVALESPSENMPPLNDNMLSLLDNIVIITFALGMIFSSILGISAAVNSYSVNKTKEIIVANDNQTATEQLRESFNQSPLEKKSYNQAPVAPVQKPIETGSTTTAKQNVKKNRTQYLLTYWSILMNVNSQAIIEQAEQLSALEKIEIVDALLASVDKPDAEIDKMWANEAEARLAAYRRGEIKALELNQVLAKYR